MKPMLGPTDSNPRTRLRNAPVIQRLLYRTAAMPNGCWEWKGSANPNTTIDRLGKRVCKTCVRERMRSYRSREAS